MIKFSLAQNVDVARDNDPPRFMSVLKLRTDIGGPDRVCTTYIDSPEVSSEKLIKIINRTLEHAIGDSKK